MSNWNETPPRKPDEVRKNEKGEFCEIWYQADSPSYPSPPKNRIRRNRKWLEDYPLEDAPPPPSEDTKLFQKAWEDEKFVKLKYKK